MCNEDIRVALLLRVALSLFLATCLARQAQQPHSPAEEVLQRLVLKPGGSTLVARLHPSAMKQEDIERMVRDVKGLRTSVLVVCADNKAEELPSGLSGVCTHIVCWEYRSSVPLGLFSSTSRQYIFWEDLENPIVSIVAPYANTWGDTVPAPPPPQPRTSDEVKRCVAGSDDAHVLHVCSQHQAPQDCPGLRAASCAGQVLAGGLKLHYQVCATTPDCWKLRSVAHRFKDKAQG